MSTLIYYIQALEQITGQLRDVADELSEFHRRQQDRADSGGSLEDMSTAYAEFIENSSAREMMEDLHKLTEQMMDDIDVVDWSSLRHDLVNANRYTVKIVNLLFGISETLAGVE